MGFSNRRMMRPSVAGSSSGGGVAVTITTQLDALRIISRTSTTGGGQSKGSGQVTLPLVFTGMQTIYCRRRSASDGVTIVQAPWSAAVFQTQGTITLTGIDVPAINADGVTPTQANDGWFYLDVATSAAGPWTNATSSVTVGRLVTIFGQSLAVRMLGRQDGQTATNATLGVVISPFTSMLATYNDSRAYMPTVSTMPWAPPADGGNYDSTFTSEYLRRQVQLFGCPAGVVGHAQTGVAITTFINGSASFGNYTQAAALIAKAGGAFEASNWYQGHTEAQYGLPDLPYGAALTQLHAGFAALNSLTAAKYVGSIPNITSTTSWGSPYQRRRIRKSVNDWAAANSAVHVQCSDVTQVDGIHESQVGALAMAQHFARATKTELSLRGDLGPALVSATRSGTTITLTLSDVGQGNLVLTGTPANRIHVFATGRYDSRTAPANNRFPVSTVTVTNKTTLSIVLANDPGDGHALDMYFYWANETGTPANDMIRDDVTDGDGITVGRQVVPNYASIQIAAPVPASTVNAPPSGFISGTSPWNMTATSPTYGVQEQTGFNQTLSGGTAISSTVSTPYFTGYTVTLRFTYLVAPAGTQVLVGGIGSQFIALNSSGKINVGSMGTGATTLTVGKRYEVVVQNHSAGGQIYIANITDGTTPIRDFTTSTPQTNASILAPASMALRNHAGGSTLLAVTATLDEVGFWQKVLIPPANTTYTPSTTPYTGTEDGLVCLYHLDGDVTEAVCW